MRLTEWNKSLLWIEEYCIEHDNIRIIPCNALGTDAVGNQFRFNMMLLDKNGNIFCNKTISGDTFEELKARIYTTHSDMCTKFI